MKQIISAPSMRKAVFFALLILSLLPLLVIPYVSRHYHQIHNLPVIEDGELDLTNYDSRSQADIPLDGEWEFFHNQWILSEPAGKLNGRLVPVPAPWSNYKSGGSPYPARGKGSYRLLLRNCPGDLMMAVYIPNINSRYRIYLNGELIASRGSRTIPQIKERKSRIYHAELAGAAFPAGSDVEIVIEMQSIHVGGLYITPVLTEYEENHINGNLRNVIAAACIGIMFVSIFCTGCFMLFKDKLLYSVALIAIDVLVCLRFMVRDEFLEVIRQVIPGFRYYFVNIATQFASFYLPFIFIYCMKQIFHMQIKKRYFIMAGVYELLLTPALLWCTANGRVRLQFYVFLASFLPFIFICIYLYKAVLKDKPYALLISGSFLFIMGSVMSASLIDSGQVVMNVSLYSPLWFVVALVFQLMLFNRRSLDLKIQATEAENLRLQLKDSETSLMLGQIQPHFLYNSLIAIHMLCLEEPEKAAETTMKFANYLRTNMRFIQSIKPIPFSQELEHIRNYADIEKIRFQKRLSVHYSVETDGFVIPALTVQPLVENAIRHGATKNLDGGNVTLHTFEKEEEFCVEVTDDGPGFDTKILESNRDNSFVISNIVFRLWEQIHAQIKFDSSPGQGTTVTITIPKGGAGNEDDNH